MGSLTLVRPEPGSAAGHGVEAAHARPAADPIQEQFAAFEALLDRHAAALAACDRIEAALIAQVGHPRVTLPRGAHGACRYAADVAMLAEAVPPGRRRQRLEQRLLRRQRRWDAAALALGYTDAQLHEACLDEAVLAAADSLLATPAWTYAALALKLLVLLSVHEPGPGSGESSPWRELRLVLADLGSLAARGETTS